MAATEMVTLMHENKVDRRWVDDYKEFESFVTH